MHSELPAFQASAGSGRNPAELQVTPPKTNMEPENEPHRRGDSEIPMKNHHF